MRVSGQFYFYEKISHAQKHKSTEAQKAQNASKQLSLRCFLYAQKAQKVQKAQNANKRLLFRQFIRA